MRRLALPFVVFPGFLSLALAGCSQGYSPNTYASSAAQEEANVQRGVIIGVRQVLISASGTIGAATGGAAGGVAGAQVSGGPVVTALGAIGGTLVGGIGGAAAAQAVADAKGWEYIVQETGDKLVSVTQTSKTALPVGMHVLVIADTQQARIVPDYTVQVAAAAPATKDAAGNPSKTAGTSNGQAATEINLDTFLPAAGSAEPVQIDPNAAANDSAPQPAASPASADPTAAPPAASSSTSGETAAPATVNNGSSAVVAPAAGSTATPVQSTPASTSTSTSPQPVSSSSTATP